MKQNENYASGGAAISPWTEQLQARLAGESATGFNADTFPAGYQYDFSVDDAVADIGLLGALQQGSDIALRLYRDAADDHSVLRFKLARQGQQIALSDVLPLLENFGLRVLGVHPYQLALVNSSTVTLHVFELEYTAPCAPSADGQRQAALARDFESTAARFEEAFVKVWQGAAESDGFNRLILAGEVDWRQVTMLRAYSKYMKQINLPYTRIYTAATLAKYPMITAHLAALFEQRFSPALQSSRQQRCDMCSAIEKNLLRSLNDVENLTEDQIIRQYLTLLRATLRSNYFQAADGHDYKIYLSFKFDVNAIPETPKPRPKYEIFVYSPEFEGVHLRGGKVARGGLRWSDRHEDFRTEILGLVKAQQVKNSVIVPMGAKGGFVCKQAPASSDREAFLANGVHCYRQFISALLELTDNLDNDKVIPPQAVVRWDDDDPY
ncbi:MAG: NAD-glutamate dehydrogenase, partial [Pseudomonadales bacterium]|nr:NAD-glutamate dehydrogenase [Pseudomonadales bacterium]